MHGEIEYVRDYYYCRNCKYGTSPQDEALNIVGLPHKMTRELMSEVAFFGQNQPSFKRARRMINRALKLDINEETIREVTEYVGKLVFEQDTGRAEETIANIHKIDSSVKEDGVLYIQTDGAAVNTRIEDENGSTWRENKTVMVFKDKDMIHRKDGGHIITKKEYLPFIGTSEDFKKYMLDIAVRAGYGKIKEVVVISDGAPWIRTVCSEIFPDAVLILDLYHLKENIYTYAKHKFSCNEKEYVPWAEIFIDKIEKGKVEEALDLLPEDEKLPSNVVNLRTYINNKAHIVFLTAGE